MTIHLLEFERFNRGLSRRTEEDSEAGSTSGSKYRAANWKNRTHRIRETRIDSNDTTASAFPLAYVADPLGPADARAL